MPPRGDWIAVSSSWSQTSGQPSASLQKWPTRGEPSLDRRRCAAAGEEAVSGLDDAELVALGVGQHHVLLPGELADVEVARAALQCPRHGRRLVGRAAAREVEVHLVGPSFRSRVGTNRTGSRVVGWQHHVASPGILDLAAEHRGPEPGEAAGSFASTHSATSSHVIRRPPGPVGRRPPR